MVSYLDWCFITIFRIEFCKIEIISDLEHFFGHKEIDANGHAVLNDKGEPIYVGFENDFVIINNEKLSVKPDKI